jgi:NTE family protein
VSGGAFTAAYYALSRSDPIAFPLNQFKERFLYRDNESEILRRVFLPFGDPFVRLAERSYVAGAYYHEKIFATKKFKDVRPQKGDLRRVPHLMINTTELVTGRRFTFTDEQFRCLGSSLDDYPIGYAVAASAALPLAFSPIRVDNYMSDPNLCFGDSGYWGLANQGSQRLHSISGPFTDPFQASDRASLILRERYIDHLNTAYLYLSDGGVSDNLGIQSFFDVASRIIPGLYSGEVKGVVLISVNAASTPGNLLGRRASSPNFFEVLSRTSDLFLQRASGSSQEEIRSTMEELEKALQRAKRPTNLLCMDVSFGGIDDESLRSTLNGIPTRLSLPKKEIDTLIAAGRFLVRRKAHELQAIRELIGDPDRPVEKPADNCHFAS